MADYAVVVGIGEYPNFEAVGALKSLKGPHNDATSVAQWLRDPQGGAVPEQNLKLIRSADFPATASDPQPTVTQLANAMQWLLDETRQSRADRLYLYFSGHGFAPVLEEPALFTAEATDDIPAYHYAYDWLRRFRQAGRFRQYVLWMDCCMTTQKSIPVAPVMARDAVSAGVPGPAFVAVAAQTKSALEHEMDDGQVHGVFTWTLLKGLLGGAADDRGLVTAQGLKAYLHDTMVHFLPASVRESQAVDLQPFVRADADIVLRRLPELPRFPVTLQTDQSVHPTRLRLWSGRPHQIVQELEVPGSSIELSLLRGLYLAEDPDSGLRHGFQVTGAGPQRITLSDTGRPVTPPAYGALYTFDVAAQNPAASIIITNDQLRAIYRSTGTLRERDRPGVYKIRVEFGRDIGAVHEQVLLLDADYDSRTAAPPVPSPAPVQAVAQPAGTHRFLASALQPAQRDQLAEGQAVLSLLGKLRLSGARRSDAPVHPLGGLDLLDAQGELVQQLDEQPAMPEQDGNTFIASWERQLPAGIYYLRYRIPDGRVVEATVVASSGWITQVVLEREPGDPGEPFPTEHRLRDAAVFMRRPGEAPNGDQQDAVIEAARIALWQLRNPLAFGRGEPLETLLLERYPDPMAKILGGYLLVRADSPADLEPDRAARFDETVRRLRAEVGEHHPDVQALSLQCVDPELRHRGPLSAPPVFTAGWELVTEASYQHPELVPEQLWHAMHATTSLGPFLAWQVDAASRSAHREQLRRWADETRQPGAALAAPIPAAAMPAPVSFVAQAAEQSSAAMAKRLGRRLRLPAPAVDQLLAEQGRLPSGDTSAPTAQR